MRKLLVPVDGSEHALEAVRYVIRLLRDGHPSDVHLVNVQPPLSGNITTFVSPSIVRQFHFDEARRLMQPACELLNRANVPYSKHIVVGYAASAIAECARDLRCNLVVMGTHGFGAIANFVLGSVSRETVHLLDPNIAVTLVKASPGTRSRWRLAPT